MRGKPTPLADRVQAVGLVHVKGVPDAAKELGVPQRTLRRWKEDPELAEVGLSARAEALPKMWVVIQAGIEEVYAGLLNPKERLRDKADALLGLMEKFALWSGEATARTESTLLSGRSDHEQRVLGELINTELERRADADAHGAQAPDPVAELTARQADTAGG